jgi:hypothetical protein
LSPDGHVDVVGGHRTNEPVRRLGQLLMALVANSEAPVQLRLTISQATAPTPAYGSIREYSEALSFFERPDRSRVLQELAVRVAAAPEPDAPASVTIDTLAPLPSRSESSSPNDAKRERSPRRSHTLKFAAVAAVIVLAVAGGAWYAWTNGFIAAHDKTEVAAIAEQASEAVGTAIISGASVVSESLGLGRIVPANQAAPPNAVPPPPAPVSEPKKRETPVVKSPAPPLLAFDLDASSGPAQGVARLPLEGRPADLSIPDAPPDDPTIYSVDSPGVLPPVAPRPQIAHELPAGFNPERLGQIELVIAKDGSVESAKLLTRPRNINDGLFLSVAKAWNFQPALKGNVPVRYRKTIWVARP